MYYKVWSNSPSSRGAHLWDYTDFWKETKTKLVEYKTDGNIIKYIIYESDTIIDDKIFDKYELNYIFLTNYTPPKKNGFDNIII